MSVLGLVYLTLLLSALEHFRRAPSEWERYPNLSFSLRWLGDFFQAPKIRHIFSPVAVYKE